MSILITLIIMCILLFELHMGFLQELSNQVGYCRVPPCQSAKQVGVEITYYKCRNNKIEKIQVIDVDPKVKISCCPSPVDQNCPIMVLIHGYAPFNVDSAAFFDETTYCYCKRAGCANIYQVRWIKGANDPNYLQSVSNTRVVAYIICKLFKCLNCVCNISLDYVIVIGHSLGAHIAGLLYNTDCGGFSLKPRTIIALDPAGPCYQCAKNKSYMLSHKSGGCVVHILTSSKGKEKTFSLIKPGLGNCEPCGHKVYVFNDGHYQSACVQDFKNFYKKDNWLASLNFIYTDIVCPHCIAYEYYNCMLCQKCNFEARPICHRKSKKCEYLHCEDFYPEGGPVEVRPICLGLPWENCCENCTAKNTPLYSYVHTGPDASNGYKVDPAEKKRLYNSTCDYLNNDRKFSDLFKINT